MRGGNGNSLYVPDSINNEGDSRGLGVTWEKCLSWLDVGIEGGVFRLV